MSHATSSTGIPLQTLRGERTRSTSNTAAVSRGSAIHEYQPLRADVDGDEQDQDHDHEDTSTEIDSFSVDPFVPFNDVEYDQRNILTIRAILVGCLCGILVNASNIYLGLKAGWTSSAHIFGAIIGFSVLKRSSRHHPFGPHENNIVQTVATASGGMSHVFVSAIPALYQLGLLRTPVLDYLRIIILTAIGGYFGLFSIAPLRKFFIRDIAREMNLLFPSSSATAITIRSMHSAASGEKAALHRTRAILVSFLIAMTLRVVSGYAIGVFWDWHVFVWLRTTNILVPLALAFESWGWIIEWTPAMIGSGMLVGPNVAFSFLLGSIAAWGIIGPYLVSSGRAFGLPRSDDPYWNGLMSYSSMSQEFITIDHPSPRYWLLWPGVACMLVVAFFELLCQWPIFWVSLRNFYAFLKSRSSIFSSKEGYIHATMNTDFDKTAPDEEIRAYFWVPGTVVIVVAACIVMKFQFGMTILETLLALSLAFFLSLSAIQATGATDTTPLTALSKVSQVLLSATTQGTDATQAAAQRLNLLGGAMTNISANQAVDLMGDFRVGFLLRTPPRLQFIAQLFGTVVATFVAPTIFVLFTQAYPCILAVPTSANDTAAEICEFPGPTIAAWRAVAVAATEPVLPVPSSSIWFSIWFSIVGCIMILVRHFFWTGDWAWIRSYQPNVMIFALSFTLPSPKYAIAMVMGATGAHFWQKYRSHQFQKYGLAIAAGLVAGEGIGGTINAMLSIIGVGGDQIGSRIGCPAGQC